MFRKNPQISNVMTIRPVEAELFHAQGRTDRQEGRHDDAIVAFRNFANARKTTLPNGSIIRKPTLKICSFKCVILQSHDYTCDVTDCNQKTTPHISSVFTQHYQKNSTCPFTDSSTIHEYFLFYLMYVCPCIIYEIDERYPLDATIYLLL